MIVVVIVRLGNIAKVIHHPEVAIYRSRCYDGRAWLVVELRNPWEPNTQAEPCLKL